MTSPFCKHCNRPKNKHYKLLLGGEVMWLCHIEQFEEREKKPIQLACYVQVVDNVVVMLGEDSDVKLDLIGELGQVIGEPVSTWWLVRLEKHSHIFRIPERALEVLDV